MNYTIQFEISQQEIKSVSDCATVVHLLTHYAHGIPCFSNEWDVCLVSDELLWLEISRTVSNPDEAKLLVPNRQNSLSEWRNNFCRHFHPRIFFSF